MRFRIFTTFIVAVLLLAGSFAVMMALHYGQDFGLTMNAEAAPPFTGGDGSAGNPFQISNVLQLQNMSANLSAHYILITDIECNITTSWNGGLGFSPIANDTNPITLGKQGDNFTGSYDGQGYKILNLSINRSGEDFIGLFGYIESNAIVKNVTLINFNITGELNVGGLIGENRGTITNCTAKGNATGSISIGGLVGISSGTITYCTTYGNATGSDLIGGLVGYDTFSKQVAHCIAYGNAIAGGLTANYVGGLIGYAQQGKVINCTAYGIASGRNNIGGLIGWNEIGPVTNCKANGNAIGSVGYIGGLLGYNDNGLVTNCTAIGNVNGTSVDTYSIGGLIGENGGGQVINCTAYGNAIGNKTIGGLIGTNMFGGQTTNCTAYGNATGKDGENIGGLIGYNRDGQITKCTAYGNATGNQTVGGLIGMNGGQVTRCTAYGMVIGNNNKIGGLIGRNGNLGDISNCTAFGSAIGLGASSRDIGGLIGYNFKVDVTNCTAYGKATGDDYVGGLIGWNEDVTVINCTAFGITNGDDYVGGLIGWINGGQVSNCTSHGAVNGLGANPMLIGGLIGYNFYANILNCTAYGKATGKQNLGGLIGYNSGGNLLNCTAYGDAFGYEECIGGLLGYHENGVISRCTAYGNARSTGTSANWYVGGFGGEISSWGTMVFNCTAFGDAYGGSYIGGFCGENGGDMYNCIAYGNASGKGNYIGGLIGSNEGDISSSISFGNATGIGNNSRYIGGLIGLNWIKGSVKLSYCTGSAFGNDSIGGFTGNNTGTVSDCYTHSDVTGNFSVGGLIGLNYGGSVDNCYSKGQVIGNIDSGGLIGNNTGTIVNSFWDKQTSGKVISNGGQGLYTYNMKSTLTYLVAGWDFDNIWAINHTVSYPYFGRFDWNKTVIIGDDYYTIAEDNVLKINSPGLLSNDFLYNLSVKSFDSTSVNGAMVSVNTDGSFAYDPTGAATLQSLAVNENMVDNFNYTIDNGLGGVGTGTVYINVTGVNDIPVLNGYSNTTSENTMINVETPGVLADDYDIDTSDNLTVQPKSLKSTNGAIVILYSNGSFSYDPTGTSVLQALAVGEYLIDSFTYVVLDGNGGMNTANASINVTGVNDAPVANEDSTKISEDSGQNAILVLMNDNDKDGDTITITQVTHGKHGTVSITGDNLILIYEPDKDYVGRDQFTYNISDGNGGTDSASVDVYIDNINDAPVWVTVLSDQNITEGDAIYLTVVASDLDADDKISYSIKSEPDSNISINSNTGEITWSDPKIGNYKFTVSASDGIETIEQNFDLTVKEKEIVFPPEPLNNKPTIDPISDQEITIGTTFELTVSGSDKDSVDIDKLVFSLSQSPAGIVISKDGDILWIPKESQIGEYTVTVSISDGKDSNSTSFTITVKKAPPIVPPKNNPPTITPVSSEQKGKAGEKYSIKISGTDSDQGDTITFSLKDYPSGMVISKDGEILWVPQEDQTGTHTVVVALSDGTNTTTISFDVIVEEGEEVTPEKEKEFSFEEGIPYLIILLIVGLIIGLLIGLIMARKRKPTEEIEDEELEDEEPEDEVPEDEVLEEELEVDELEEEELEEEELEEEELEDEELDEEELEE